MHAPTGASFPLPSKTQDFHLIRPVCALGTFPSRGRLAEAFSFLAVQFFDCLIMRYDYIYLPERRALVLRIHWLKPYSPR